jgi:hypothetical protein
MMDKISTRFILFIIIGVVVLFFLLKGRSPFGKGNTSFAVRPGTEVTTIDFFEGDKKLSLQKSGVTWMVNKTSEARESAIKFILRTLKEIKIKSPVSSEIFRDEIISKKIIPVKVNVYERRKLVKSFFVYKTGSNIYGNIMKLKVSSKPFIVYIPGYEDNIGTYFSLNDLFWKPYSICNLLPSEIASVEFNNFNETDASFKISNTKNVFSLSDLNGKLSGWDTLKVKRYITYFISIPFETWAFDLSQDDKKQIESQPPLYRLIITRTGGGNTGLTIWEKWNMNNDIRQRDTDRVWARMDGVGDIMIIRYFDIDPILKKKSYFFGD